MDNLHQKILELMAGKEGKLLDAGAGTGELSAALSGMGFKVSSCDIHPKDFRHGSCRKVDLNRDMPYKKNEFDHVVCAEVVEHIENPYHLLRQANKVMKKGGCLVITTPNIANVFSRLKFLITGKFFCFSDEERRLGHLNPIPWWEMEEALEKCGFKVEKKVASANLLISSRGGAAAAKRALARLSMIVLHPFMKPKSGVLLKADSIVFLSVKAKEC